MDEILVKNLRAINPFYSSHQVYGMVSSTTSLDLYFDDVNDEVSKYIVYKSLDSKNWNKIGENKYTWLRDDGFYDRADAWYSVSYVNPLGEESKKGEILHYSLSNPYLWNLYQTSRSIMAKTRVLYDYVAEEVGFYRVNRTGKKCTCYNFNLSSGSSNCEICGGSGFLDFWAVPMKIDGKDPQVRIHNAGETVDFYPFGKVFVNTPSALAIGLPVLRAGDFIYRKNNPEGKKIMYRIENTHIKAYGNNGLISFITYQIDEKGGDEFFAKGGKLE